MPDITNRRNVTTHITKVYELIYLAVVTEHLHTGSNCVMDLQVLGRVATIEEGMNKLRRRFKADNVATIESFGQRMTKPRGVKSHSNSNVGWLSVTSSRELRVLLIEVSNPEPVSAEIEFLPRCSKSSSQVSSIIAFLPMASPLDK